MNPYPLQVTVYHLLTVQIHQSPRDVFELSERIVSKNGGQQLGEIAPARTDSHPCTP